MPIKISGGRYYSPVEAAKLAAVNLRRIYQLCGAGTVGAVQIGEGRSHSVWLIPVEQFDRWMAERKPGRPKR